MHTRHANTKAHRKALPCNEYVVVKGYVSTHDLDADGDIIAVGVFENVKKLFDERRVMPVFYNHRRDQCIGQVVNMTIDTKGLRATVLIADQRLCNAILAKDYQKIGGFSIGFYALREQSGATSTCKKIVDLDVQEISIVDKPANPEARILEFYRIDSLSHSFL